MNSQPRTDYVTHQTRHAERGNNRPMGLLPTVSRQFLDWVRNRVRVRVRVRVKVRVAVQELSCNRCPHWGMWGNVTYTAIASNYT